MDNSRILGGIQLHRQATNSMIDHFAFGEP